MLILLEYVNTKELNAGQTETCRELIMSSKMPEFFLQISRN